MPNFGTKDTKEVVEPTVKPAENLEQLFQEFKSYRRLKKKDDLESNQTAGTPAFLISLQWLKKYSKYLLEDQFDFHQTIEKVQV